MRKPPHLYTHLDILSPLRDELPQTIEIGYILARWSINKDENLFLAVPKNVAGILVSVREQNDSWVTLAARVLERDLQDNIALGGDDMCYFVTCQYLRSGSPKRSIWEGLSKLDIRNTLPRLQHDFCTLWNEIVQKAWNRGFNSDPVHILRWIRHP